MSDLDSAPDEAGAGPELAGDPEATGPAVPEAVVPPGTRRARVGRTIRGLAVDLTPLRASRDYRLLTAGQLISDSGRQVTIIAIYIQVFRLTDSAAAVGLVGVVELVPLIVASFIGQSIVDAVDRRKLLLVTQIAYACVSTFLMITAFSDHPPLALVYTGAGLGAAISGVSGPTRTAMVPRLVGRSMMSRAVALNQVAWNTTAIAGPALGGLIVGHLGLPWAYGFDAVTYGATIAAIIAMRPMPPEDDADRATGVAAIREGFAYLRGRRVLQSTFTIDLVAMIFGMPRALFPVLALTQFHRTGEAAAASLVGFLASALAVGALLGAVSAGWVGRIRHQGRAVIVAVALWGLAIVAFGLAGSALWLALLCLAAAGAADVISAVFRGTILQVSVPDRLRGRMSAVHILVVTGGPRLGDAEAGLVAQAFSPFVSVISGGIACVVGVGVVAALVPQFWAYDIEDEEAVARG